VETFGGKSSRSRVNGRPVRKAMRFLLKEIRAQLTSMLSYPDADRCTVADMWGPPRSVGRGRGVFFSFFFQLKKKMVGSSYRIQTQTLRHSKSATLPLQILPIF
jgi:hypothetical protein